MNIAIGRIGMVMNFLPEKWGHGGDIESMSFIYWLAKNFPEHEFYVVSKSNGAKVFENRVPNLHFFVCENSMNYPRYKKYLENREAHEEEFCKYINAVDVWMKDVKIDYGFMFMGIIYERCLPYANKKLRYDVYTRPSLIGFAYASNVVTYLNHSMIPYSYVTTDVRHIKKNPNSGIQIDLVNVEEHCLGQENCDVVLSDAHRHKIRRWKGIEVRQKPVIKIEYAGFETAFLLTKNPIQEFQDFDEEFLRKKSGFILAHNFFCKPKTPIEKIPRYQKFCSLGIFELPVETKIYGDWPEYVMEKHEQFKGPVRLPELSKKLLQAKYTLCLGTDGMATQKFLEFAHHGVIPFVDENYATNCDLEYIDPWFRISSKEELLKKLKFLEKSEENYFSKLRILHGNLFKKSGENLLYYSGKYLLDHVNRITGLNLEKRKLKENLEFEYAKDIRNTNSLERFM
jgi:hypothetical protein